MVEQTELESIGKKGYEILVDTSKRTPPILAAVPD